MASEKTAKSAPKRASRLGRGLSSLMAKPVEVTPPADAAKEQVPTKPTPPVAEESPRSSETPEPAAAAAVSPPAPVESGTADPDAVGISYLAVDSIQPNPGQPRQHFDEITLTSLANSIAADGMMQPIIVRPTSRAGAGEAAYEIVAGERRWRAAGLAKLSTIPAIVRDLDNRQVAEWALIENLQREDLNPMERAEAFANLATAHGLSHDEIAQRVGLNRPSVSNLLRLLALDEPVQELVRQGILSLGHARAIVTLTDTKLQRVIAKQLVREDWSVRRTEQAVRAAANGPAAGGGVPKGGHAPTARQSHLRDLEEAIGHQLGTKIRITPGRKKGTGTLSIDFYSIDEFDSLLERLGVTVD